MRERIFALSCIDSSQNKKNVRYIQSSNILRNNAQRFTLNADQVMLECVFFFWILMFPWFPNVMNLIFEARKCWRLCSYSSYLLLLSLSYAFFFWVQWNRNNEAEHLSSSLFLSLTLCKFKPISPNKHEYLWAPTLTSVLFRCFLLLPLILFSSYFNLESFFFVAAGCCCCTFFFVFVLLVSSMNLTYWSSCVRINALFYTHMGLITRIDTEKNLFLHFCKRI